MDNLILTVEILAGIFIATFVAYLIIAIIDSRDI